MKKKNEIYVVVDTLKKAKKLAKVLDMFGEPVFDEHSVTSAFLNGWGIKFLGGEEWGTSTDTSNLDEVTIKELRSILAEEKLKYGDVVVCKNSTGKWIQEIGASPKLGEECIKKVFIDGLEHETEYCHGFIKLDEFLRYATEEEKALLKPKPSVGTGCLYYKGKWAEVVKEAPKFEVKIDGDNLKQVVERINEALNTDISSYKTDVKITDEDIAVVERLHDALLDNHGYNLDASMLKNARVLTHKLRQLI